MVKARLGYLDIAKAIAIAFVIIGHTGIVFNGDVVPGGMPNWLERFSFTLQLPVFFIVSGYFFKLSTPLNGQLVKKDATNLLLPYLVTCVLIVFTCSLQGFLSPTQSGSQEFLRWFGASLFGAGAVSPVAVVETERIGGIWFLLALFWARMLIAATHRLPDWARFLIMTAAFLVAAWSAQFVWLPLSIQSGMGCAIYLFIGALIHKYHLFDKGRIPATVWVVFLCLWGITIGFGGQVSMAMVNYPLGIFDFLGGIAACFCIIRGSAFIEEHTRQGSPWLQAIGRNTLAIFTLHIVEDNVLPWGNLGLMLSEAWGGFPLTWVVLQALRFGVDALLVFGAYIIPGIRWVYFPQLRKRRPAKMAPAGYPNRS